jgi:hypothetical protein
MENIRLFTYKMTHDTGFAPNPFHGFLTLANCKPCIRKYKKKDDWIAGFTSKKLNGDNVGEERLVYLMKVTDKITYDEYWNNPAYKLKKPNLSSSQIIDRAGDNIYKPVKSRHGLKMEFEQMHNKNHNEGDKENDLKGENVLFSNCFYYFGYRPLKISDKIRPSIPKGQAPQGVLTHDIEKASKFIQYIQNNYTVGKVVNMPHHWIDENIKNKKCK